MIDLVARWYLPFERSERHLTSSEIPIMRRASQVFHCIVISALGALHPAGAQDELRIDQDLSFDRTESWAMKYFASVNLFTGLGVPREMEPGSLELGLELDWVPHP